MTEPNPAGVPSAEEEALWRKRFGLFALLRLSGLAMMLGGISVAFTGVARPGGWPIPGAFLVFSGVIGGLIAPHLLRRRWKQA